MKSVAVITGASSGMGRLFAKTVTAHGNFDEIWVIARRADRLEELKNELSIPVKTVCLDLSERESYARYGEMLKSEKPVVQWLIHCSGFGKFQATMDVPLEINLNMLDLNCAATMALDQLTVPYMPAGSHIVNVASVAAYQPIPYINVYGATKAFVLHYSRALDRELRPRGIAVTAVCPFWTKTEFFNRAVDKDDAAVVKKYVAMHTPEQIVRRAWRDAERGKDVSKFGFIARLQVILAKLLPHWFVMWYWMRQQKLNKESTEKSAG
ncbi:MAG: SDR family NAD(P)-dependent oxidoreductase [Acutalibacteraceae bacterium]|jgi:short-subunit dehydrogenase